jgi:hypothetical protein
MYYWLHLNFVRVGKLCESVCILCFLVCTHGFGVIDRELTREKFVIKKEFPVQQEEIKIVKTVALFSQNRCRS